MSKTQTTTSITRWEMIVEKCIAKGAWRWDAEAQVSRLENVFTGNRHFVSGNPKRISVSFDDDGAIKRIAVTLTTHHEVVFDQKFVVADRRFEFIMNERGAFKARMLSQ